MSKDVLSGTVVEKLASCLHLKAKKVGAVQPGEEKAPGRSSSGLPAPEGATGRMERGFSQGCVVIGQGGMALN